MSIGTVLMKARAWTTVESNLALTPDPGKGADRNDMISSQCSPGATAILALRSALHCRLRYCSLRRPIAAPGSVHTHVAA
eukprot:1413471-Pyramimonas_sp.AAC.1